MTDATLDVPDRPELPRSMDKLAGLPLFAWVDRDGRVTGITNCARYAEQGIAPSLDPDPRGNRYLPLYGADTFFDLVTEVRSPPAYVVEADRVTRTYTVRNKTAAELLREIAWWYGALHSSGTGLVSPAFDLATRETPGMSPSQVNDSARAMMARLRETPDAEKDQSR